VSLVCACVCVCECLLFCVTVWRHSVLRRSQQRHLEEPSRGQEQVERLISLAEHGTAGRAGSSLQSGASVSACALARALKIFFSFLFFE